METSPDRVVRFALKVDYPIRSAHRSISLSLSMSLLRTAAAKAQHPLKLHTPNGDMTMDQPYFVGVFDGVGGVESVGLRPEDMSWDLREQIRALLFWRSQPGVDRNNFDNQLLAEIGFPVRAAHTLMGGQWLRDTFLCAALRTEALGATTIAAAWLQRTAQPNHIFLCSALGLPNLVSQRQPSSQAFKFESKFA